MTFTPVYDKINVLQCGLISDIKTRKTSNNSAANLNALPSPAIGIHHVYITKPLLVFWASVYVETACNGTVHDGMTSACFWLGAVYYNSIWQRPLPAHCNRYKTNDSQLFSLVMIQWQSGELWVGETELKLSERQLKISVKGNYGCLKFQLPPKFLQNKDFQPQILYLLRKIFDKNIIFEQKKTRGTMAFAPCPCHDASGAKLSFATTAIQMTITRSHQLTYV